MIITVKALRISKGLKQSDMAKMMGIAVSTYNYKENGRSPFNEDEINILLNLFDTTYEQLFSARRIRNNRINDEGAAI